MDIRQELMDDFERLNKKMVKYSQALKVMQGEGKPPCFTPAVDPDKLQVVVWTMGQLLDCILESIKEE